MKKSHLFLVFILFTLSTFIKAQTIFITVEGYHDLKASGKLNPRAKYQFLTPNTITDNKLRTTAPVAKALNSASTSSTSACQCMIPIDPTFTVVPFLGSFPPSYRNDDDFSASIPLGFNFCFYGSTYTSCFINNNGNITFNSGLFSFSAGGFPAGNMLNPDTIMIAPFWGDVDTQDPGSGLVYYKKTPTALIVKWDHVGYFNSMSDKVNTFQLIITDGNDPLLPNGNNVAFCYGDMQWTTGDASNGTNGFGGIPATVGVNKGDHSNYIQLGRFDQAGSSYDGPYGLNDGISFLDNKSYFFNICGTNNNLPPIVQDATGGGSVCGDTIRICSLGDTLVYSTTFLAPENNQTITINGTAPTLGGSFQPLSVTSTTAGTTTYAWMVVASPTVTGIHTVVVTGTDNGIPPLSTSATYYIKIENIPIPQPTLSIAPTSGTVCATPGATLALVNCSSYDNVYWSNGSSGCSIVASASGVYFATVNKLGCYKSTSDTVVVFPNPVPVITGPLNYCNPATSTTLTLEPPLVGMPTYTSYVWNPGAVNSTTVALTGGLKTLLVTDINGCTASKTFSIIVGAPTINIAANPTSICGSVGTSTLYATMAGTPTYTWSTGDFTQNTIVTSPENYTVSGTVNGCMTTKTISILSNPIPTVTIPSSAGICTGSNATISTTSLLPAGGAYTYTWSNGSNSSSILVGTTSTITVRVKDILTGCVSAISNSCNVSAVSNPTVSFATNPIIFCAGFYATLSPSVTGGNPNYTYAWTPSSLGTAATATTNVSTGTFSVRVTDQYSCKTTGTVSVTKSTPVINFNAPDLLICPGECVKVKAIGISAYTPGVYSWSNNSSNTTDSATVCVAGMFTTTYTDAQGCIATKTLAIGNDAVPLASFIATPPSPVVPDQPVDFTNTSTIATGSISSSIWNFGDGNGGLGNTITYGFPSAGVFPVSLIVIGSNGCRDTVYMNYQVDAILVIPNVITPNGDKANDLLKFKNLNFFTSNNLVIFNRWGKKVFEQDNYKNDWDGDNFSDGTYFFILNVPDASPKTYNGYFQIIH